MNWLNEVLNNDPDPAESREWIESLKAVIDHDGPARAHQLLNGMVELTRRAGAHLPFAPTTEYINTIPPGQRSEEHTSELQSLMRISYAVFCLQKKTTQTT